MAAYSEYNLIQPLLRISGLCCEQLFHHPLWQEAVADSIMAELTLFVLNSQCSLKKSRALCSSCPISWDSVLSGGIKGPLTMNFISVFKMIIKIMIQGPYPISPFL